MTTKPFSQPATLLQHLTLQGDSRCFRYKYDWFSQIISILTKYGLDLKEKCVLEVGAGVHTPLGTSIISAMYGAAWSHSMEPGKLAPSWVTDGLSTLYLAAGRFFGTAFANRLQVISI